MSENRKRRSRPCCKVCFHPGYTRGTSDCGRPRFKCDKCGHIWTHGKDGGEYMGFAMNDPKPAASSRSAGR